MIFWSLILVNTILRLCYVGVLSMCEHPKPLLIIINIKYLFCQLYDYFWSTNWSRKPSKWKFWSMIFQKIIIIIFSIAPLTARDLQWSKNVMKKQRTKRIKKWIFSSKLIPKLANNWICRYSSGLVFVTLPVSYRQTTCTIRSAVKFYIG